MITFLLIIAISMGLAFGVNALLLEKKPRGAFVTALITVAIAIVSVVIGLIVSVVIIEKMGYRIAVDKAIGPSIAVAFFATWGTLKRRKRSDPWVEPDETSQPSASVGPRAESVTVPPIGNQVPRGASWSRILLMAFTGVVLLGIGYGVGYQSGQGLKQAKEEARIAKTEAQVRYLMDCAYPKKHRSMSEASEFPPPSVMKDVDMHRNSPEVVRSILIDALTKEALDHLHRGANAPAKGIYQSRFGETVDDYRSRIVPLKLWEPGKVGQVMPDNPVTMDDIDRKLLKEFEGKNEKWFLR